MKKNLLAIVAGLSLFGVVGSAEAIWGVNPGKAVSQVSQSTLNSLKYNVSQAKKRLNQAYNSGNSKQIKYAQKKLQDATNALAAAQ